MTERTTLLFVDDEPRVLEAMRRSLRSFRERWDVAFAVSGAEALEAMRARRFDVVVTDMRMPQMSGAELLERVCAEHTATMRVVLSGQTDFDAALRSVTLAHQFLGKPCAPDVLMRTLNGMVAALSTIQDTTVRDTIVGMRRLPASSDALARLDALLARDDGDVAAIADVVVTDVALSVKVLQVSQSSLFGARAKTTDVRGAVRTLGVPLLRQLRAVAFDDGAAMPATGDLAEGVGLIVQRDVATKSDDVRLLGAALLGLWGAA